MKVAYAAYTKGAAALLLAVQAFAKGQRVDDALRAEWELSQPGLLARGRRRGQRRGTEGVALGR